MLNSSIYLILGISTDIGKTYFVENLCRLLPNSFAIKPIASGMNDEDENSDPAKILAALGRKNNLTNLNEISPWRFEDPVSPHFAGKIDFLEVKDFCVKKILAARQNGSFLFIEAAGGVMTPINDDKTFLDLAQELQIPVLLVSANYLGSISHTLCALEALKARNVKVEKVILNEGLLASEKSSMASSHDVARSIEKIGGIRVALLQEFLKKNLD